MILGWAQTQPSGRVVTHLHWIPGSLPRMCAPCRLGRRPPLTATPLTAAVARSPPPPPASPPPVVGRRLLRGLPRGYCEATTRPPRGLLRGYYLILSRLNGTVTAPIRCKKRHARFRLRHAFFWDTPSICLDRASGLEPRLEQVGPLRPRHAWPQTPHARPPRRRIHALSHSK